MADSAITRSPIARSGWSPPQVPTRISFLTPSWTSSSITIAADGQPMPLACTETGSPVERPGVAEHAALGVALLHAVAEGLCDVLRPQRVAGEKAGVRVVTRVRSHVDRHSAEA